MSRRKAIEKKRRKKKECKQREHKTNLYILHSPNFIAKKRTKEETLNRVRGKQNIKTNGRSELYVPAIVSVPYHCHMYRQQYAKNFNYSLAYKRLCHTNRNREALYQTILTSCSTILTRNYHSWDKGIIIIIIRG
jgi:hypothetical protein